MRVLLSTYGSRGDVEPLVALAVALKAQGAEAAVSAPGDAEFVELIARAGVAFAPACMPVRQWIDEARRNPGTISDYAARLCPLQYAAIDEAAAGCDAIVATGLMPSAGAAHAIAEKRHLFWFHVNFWPRALPSDRHWPHSYPGHPIPPEVTDPARLWALNRQTLDALFADAINAQRSAVALPPVDHVRDRVFTDRPFLASDPVLWPWEPTDLCHPVQTGAWILADQRPLAPDLQAFLEGGTPPVYLGFGSIAVQGAQEIAEAAISAIRAQGCRIVLARGWADMAPVDAAGDCFAVGEVNQQALFRRCAVIVHHGGAGTTHTAACAGVPQIVVPQIVDQPDWAARVARLGIGVAHDGPKPDVASLAAALESARAPAMHGRARAVAGTMRTDGADRAATMLLESIR